MPNADNIVMSAKKFKIYKYDAPEVLSLPTVSGPTVTWGTGWDDAPYVTEDGVTLNFTREQTETKAFMHDDPVKIHNEETVTIDLTFLESGADVVSMVFPSVEVNAAGWTHAGGEDAVTEYALGIETETEVWIIPRVQHRGDTQLVFRNAEHNTVTAQFVGLREWALADDGVTLVATGERWYRETLEETPES